MKFHVMDICREGVKHLVNTLVKFLKLVLKQPSLHSMSLVKKISFRLHGLYSTHLEGVVLYTVKQRERREASHTL